MSNNYLSKSYTSLLRYFPWLASLASAVCLCFVISHRPIHWPIRADGVGYYAYLPSKFLYRDPGMLKYHAKLTRLGYPPIELYPGWTGISRVESTGRYLDKYNLGTAFLVSPFFYGAHLVAGLLGYRDNGFTLPFRIAVGLAGAFYLGLGLWALAKLLRRHFSESIVASTLLSITFATNLFHYSFYDSSFSHIYSFAMVALLLLLTDNFYARPTRPRVAAVGACVGILLLIRCANGLIAAAVLLLWACSNYQSIKARTRFLVAHLSHYLLAGVVAAVLFTPQLLAWKYATGSYFVYSYGMERLSFQPAHIWDILFSPQKGLLITFPVLWLVIIGLVVTKRATDQSAISNTLLIIFHSSITLLLYSSWTAWDLGGGFGHRGFVESLPIFSLAIATALAAFPRRLYAVPMALVAVSIVLVSYNSIQYWFQN